MYEESTRRFNINWKSLLIKMAILLIALFLVMFVISLFNKKDDKVNVSESLALMKDAATEYFKGSKLPSNLNSKTTITLKEMFDNKLLVEFDGANTCDLDESYAEATKVSSTDYTIKVKLMCGKEADYVINTVSIQTVDNTDKDTIVNNNTDKDTNKDKDTTSSNTNNTNSNSNNSSNSGNVTRPNNSTNNNTSTNNSGNSTLKPSGSTSNSSTNKPSNTVTVGNTTSCSYGTKEYNAKYPLAYVVSDSCAISKSGRASDTNKVSALMVNEYVNITKEMKDLSNEKGVNLVVEKPIATPVYNKAFTGIVGYQIYVAVKYKNNYAYETVYSYYLNSNGKRTAVIDKRNKINVKTSSNSSSNNNTGNNTSSNKVTSLTLDKTSLSLKVGETDIITATIKPASASNKIISYTSSNTSVATVSSKGVVTARGKGTATITASVDGVKATAKVTVSDTRVSVTKVTLNKSSLSIEKGSTYQLKATVSPTNATNKTVTWKSNNTSIVTVNSNGLVSAKGIGSATITATVDGVRATVKVNVLGTEKDVKSVTITDGDLTLNVGDTHKINYKLNPSEITSYRVYYYTTDSDVISISNGVIKAKKAGKAIVEVTVNGKSDTILVTVKSNKLETYTNTYYLMSYVNSSYVGKNYSQEFIFKDIPLDIDYIHVDVYHYDNTLNDYKAYSSKKWDNVIPLSKGYSNTGYLQSISPEDFKYSALTSDNFAIQMRQIKRIGNYYGFELVTYIKSVTNKTVFNNSYFVPVKVVVTYTR